MDCQSRSVSVTSAGVKRRSTWLPEMSLDLQEILSPPFAKFENRLRSLKSLVEDTFGLPKPLGICDFCRRQKEIQVVPGNVIGFAENP